MGPFELLVSNLNQLGFFGFLLPWVFMFVVSYGLITKTKLFENPRVVGVLSLVLAFFVVGFGGPFLASFFTTLFGYAAIIIAGILVIVLFITMSGGNIAKVFDNKGVAVLLAGIGIIVFFIAIGGGGIAISDSVLGIVFIIIVMAVAVYFIAGSSGG